MIDNAAEFFLFLPAYQGVGDTGDTLGRDEVLGVALLENSAGINEKDFALPGFWLGLVEEQDDTWGGGVVEEVFGQIEDALDEVLLNKPLANGFFLVGAGIARASGGGTGVEDDGGATFGIEAGVHVLDPAPVGGRFSGETGREAVEFVIVVVGLDVPVLVPHGISDDAIESTQLAVFFGAELGVLEGVADLDPALHIVDDHIHVGHGPGLGDVFLAEQFEGRVLRLVGGCHFRFHGELALDEKAAGAAGGVVDFHARIRPEDMGYDIADFAGGVELAGTLAAALGELADKVFVALADDVGLDVLKPETLGADGLNEVGEAVVVEVALAVGGRVEVHAVDDALQGRVFPGDGPHVAGDAFADLVRELANDGPDRLFGIVRHEGEVEADKLVVGSGELEGFLARADLGVDAVQFIIKDIAQAFGEDEGQDVVLVFRGVLGPTDGAGGVPYPGFQGFEVGQKNLPYQFIETPGSATGSGLLGSPDFLSGNISTTCSRI